MLRYIHKLCKLCSVSLQTEFTACSHFWKLMHTNLSLAQMFLIFALSSSLFMWLNSQKCSIVTQHSLTVSFLVTESFRSRLFHHCHVFAECFDPCAAKLLERMETEVSFITRRFACVWVLGRGTCTFLSTDANELLCEKRTAKRTLAYQKYQLFNEAIFFVILWPKTSTTERRFIETMRFIRWL